MRLSWEQKDSWFDRTYVLVDDEDNVVEEMGEDPSLIELREAEQRFQQRIDLWQTGLVCSDCGNEINGRFGATPRGEILCFDCAEKSQAKDDGDLVVNTDPAQATLSESKLHQKSLCDYVINVATGCRHGCRFCYVPDTPALKNREETLEDHAHVGDVQQDWGSYLLYRDDIPERLRTDLETEDEWKCTDRGRGVVMLSSGTDCYQDRRTAQITHSCIRELISSNRPVRILTRSPAVVRDIDLFKEAGDLITIGTSIPTLDDEIVRVMEPGAPLPSARWEALDEIRQAGIPRFVSMSPTYPTMGEEEIWNTLTFIKALDPEVVFHEPINPRGRNFEMCVEAAEEANMFELAAELERLLNPDKWVEYAVEQIVMVRRIADEIGGLDIHTWPDQELIKSTSSELRFKLSDMKKAVSPESFGGDVEPERQPEIDEDMSEIMSNIR